LAAKCCFQSRGARVAERLLEGCTGYVQSDGYNAYDGVAVTLALTHVGCMAHARRRFFEAIKALPHSQQKTATAAHEAVRRIDELYTIERETKALAPEQRQRIRQQQALPRLESLHAWAEDLVRHTLPSGKLGEALDYLLRQWPKLVRYIEDPRLAIDANLAENAIRPFAFGTAELVGLGHHQGRRGERHALQPDRNGQGEWPRALRIRAPAVCQVAKGPDRRGNRGSAAVSVPISS